jgi:hypothetical protein
MRRRRVILWKIVLGIILIYLEIKDIFFPVQIPDFQPSNLTQVIGMRFAQILIVGVGAWLLLSGIAGKRAKPIASNSAAESERVRNEDALDHARPPEII